MTKEARVYNGEKTASSINGVGKTGLLYCTVYKNKLKLDKDLNVDLKP